MIGQGNISFVSRLRLFLLGISSRFYFLDDSSEIPVTVNVGIVNTQILSQRLINPSRFPDDDTIDAMADNCEVKSTIKQANLTFTT